MIDFHPIDTPLVVVVLYFVVKELIAKLAARRLRNGAVPDNPGHATREDTDKIWTAVNLIRVDVAGLKARVDGLERAHDAKGP